MPETGTDLKSSWPAHTHFNSWMNQCPNNKISGGKVISSKVMKKKTNPASQVFRRAANALQKSDIWLGHYFRRMKAKGGHKYAIVATANKLATIYYIMVTEKKEYDPSASQHNQQKYNLAKIVYYQRKLKELEEQIA